MMTIHDRQPVVLPPDIARRGIAPELTSVQAEELAQLHELSAAAFTWHTVSKAVGNVKNDSPEMIHSLSGPEQ